MKQGKFITFEGIDGAGKSTQIAWLEAYLKQRGLEVVMTREPGGTPLGEKLRGLLLSEPMHLSTEALLMFAARCEHLEQVIRPALDSGKWVISDRFSDASFAYQGGGRGIDTARLAKLEDWVQQGFQPDLTLLFDLPVEVARGRLSNNATLDRFELEQNAFFERVRQAYLARAKMHPERLRVIDANQPIGSIRNQLESIMLDFCS